MITRPMTFASILALAVPLLSHSSPDSRMVISIVVSVGVLMLAIRAFSLARFVWGLVFLALLGVYTPFRSAEFSPRLYLIFDLVTLALFAVSPLILKRAKIPAISTAGSRMAR